MKSHGCAGFQVSKLEETCGHVGIIVEEAEEGVLELWEFLLAGHSLIILQVVVQQVNCFLFK